MDVLIGSKYFATHLPSSDYKPLYGVVWDMIGDKDLRLPYEGHSFQQAPEVVARVWQTAAELAMEASSSRKAGAPSLTTTFRC